ncbi:MAG: glycoside hydrolase family 25 protein [Paraprevotella sp.]|nr:glycoside hydrolase family 25 protein [Paraprevotella sp.]
MCAGTPQTLRNKKPKTQAASPRKRSGTTARSPRRKASPKSKKKRGEKWLFFKRWPSWMIWTGAILLGLIYILFFYYVFVSPSSFRWKAIYGDPVYPDGFDVHGIDVSHYQEDIDWERLRNASLNSSPVSFIFIKATEGAKILDDNFNQNFYEAKKNDFIRGAYHFFVPDVDARQQARFFLKQVHLEPGDLPPVLDVEKVGDLTDAQLQKAVKTWLDLVEKEYGVKPIIYTGYKFKLRYLNTPDFDGYPYWTAHYYVKKLEYKGPWRFWQHTDCGSVSGLKGAVDCDIFNGSLEELMKMTIPDPDTVAEPEDSL